MFTEVLFIIVKAGIQQYRWIKWFARVIQWNNKQPLKRKNCGDKPYSERKQNV